MISPFTEAAFVSELEKIAGVLPSFLADVRKKGFLDPRSDDFSKNQAFGRGLGAALAPAMAAGMVGGFQLGGGRGVHPATTPALLALAALSGTGTYAYKLRKFRQLQAEGRNPVTGKKHDPAKIERTRAWALKRHAQLRGSGK